MTPKDRLEAVKEFIGAYCNNEFNFDRLYKKLLEEIDVETQSDSNLQTSPLPESSSADQR